MEEHPCFRPPQNEDIKVWRFMDFTKYISLLHTKKLFFSRADLLGDPYEGSIAHMNKKLHPIIYKNKIPVNMLQLMSSVRKGIVQWTYVNCWYMNEHESNAMWVSTKTDKSVVIQSRYKNLYECLKSTKAYLGIVNYIDYEKHFVPEDNTLWPFIHKRQEFDYEEELRAVISDSPPTIDKKLNYGIPNGKRGVYIPIPVNSLIESVYTNPSADIWFLFSPLYNPD